MCHFAIGLTRCHKTTVFYIYLAELKQQKSKKLITGSALALHCCKAHAKINTKIENSTPCKIVTHEDFNLKLGTRDYVADVTHHATLGSNRPSGGYDVIFPQWVLRFGRNSTA